MKSWVLGPLLTLMVLALLTLMGDVGRRIGSAGSLVLLSIIASAALGGTICGLLSSLFALVFVAALAERSGGWSPGAEGVSRLTSFLIAGPASALIVGLLKSRADAAHQESLTRNELEAAQRRSAFLSEADGLLERGHDYRGNLKGVARLIVPFLADWCTIDLLENERLVRHAAVHSDPLQEPLLRRIEPIDSASTLQAERTGFLSHVYEFQLASLARSNEQFQLWRELRPRSLLRVPLLWRGASIGLITFGASQEGSALGSEQVVTAQELAQRISLTVDNAQLYERVQRANSLLQSTLESTVEGILVTDGKGRIVSLNQTFVRMWRIPAWLVESRDDEATLDFVSDQLVRPEVFRDRVRELYSAPLDSGFDTVEFKDGRVFERASIPQLLEGRPVGRVFSFRDVTEQRCLLEREKSARSSAQEAERKATFLAQIGKVTTESLDLSAMLKRVAGLVVPLLADVVLVDLLEEDQSIRRVAIGGLESLPAPLLEELRRRSPRSDEDYGVTQVLRGTQSIVSANIISTALRTPSTDPVRAEIAEKIGVGSGMIVPLLARNRTLGAMTFARTTAVQYGADDLRLAEELCQRVALSVDNARLYRTAREAAESREEFLSIASHELKTPITSLVLQFELLTKLNRNLSGPGSELAQGVIEQAREQCLRLQSLIDELLDVTRLSRRLELDREPVELDELVRSVAARFRDQAAHAACRITLDIPFPVRGDWDRMRLEQVLTNLISNALKYGRGKPVEISLRELPSERAEIAVQDHGIGIAPDFQDRIFERFSRAVTGKEYKGLGLGLYIVRQIVDAHDGKIRVESVPGSGSKFTVVLPKRRSGTENPQFRPETGLAKATA